MDTDYSRAGWGVVEEMVVIGEGLLAGLATRGYWSERGWAQIIQGLVGDGNEVKRILTTD